MAGEVDGFPQGGIGRQGIELYGIGEIVMKNQSEYYVVMAADDNYARHLGVCLIPLFENNRDRKFAVSVFSDNISIDNIGKIEEMCRRYGNRMILINPEQADYERSHVTSYYSKATWFRLKLAD